MSLYLPRVCPSDPDTLGELNALDISSRHSAANSVCHLAPASFYERPEAFAQTFFLPRFKNVGRCTNAPAEEPLGFIKPTPPPYDPMSWAQLPFPEKSRQVCQAWALQGYGTPGFAYVVYALKVLLYIGGWALFCDRSGETWWLETAAFQKAILWSLFFEGLGLGCGSGPLTGRYFPPLGGCLYFLRPGTTKLPLFPKLFGPRRTPLDVALYFAHNVFLVRALLAPELTLSLLLPTLVLLPVLGVLDRTLFLAARGEHYYWTLICFAFAGDWIAGAKVVQAALWFWAGVSKLNHHFPSVVGIMTSNSPLLAFRWLRKRMYRHYPDDLRPSNAATLAAHLGGLTEFVVPIVLVLGTGGNLTLAGLMLMVFLHAYITSNVPMGVPIEWNFMMVYGGFFLFGKHAAVRLTDVESPWLAAFLVVAVGVIPLFGNVAPSRVSFLMSMRYYAGNWAYSIWLFKKDSYRKLDQHLVKSSKWLYDQLDLFYDRPTSVGLVGKVMAFRQMHLHGRALQTLVPRAVTQLSDYEFVDGEFVCGLVLGWNFGDGHLHSEGLLRNIQAQCHYEEEELRCIFVEAQPLFGKSLHYRIVDAKTGERESGELEVAELRRLQPWAT
ncbi:MAG: DUF3556 domain-containing protein [Myxococcaceae bacterium]